MVTRWSEIHTRVSVRSLSIVERTVLRRSGIVFRTERDQVELAIGCVGWIVDNDELLVTMPPGIMQKRCRHIAEWPPSHK